MQLKKNIANFITSIRLFGAIALFFVKPISPAYFWVFGICGLSDAIDGFVARKVGITSEFGSKLDSVADLSFYSAMMITLLQKLGEILFLQMWIPFFIIIAIRVSIYLISAIRFGKFSSLHTMLNKATGLGMFLVPIILAVCVYALGDISVFGICASKFYFNIYAGLLSLVGLAAAIHELVYYINLKR